MKDLIDCIQYIKDGMAKLPTIITATYDREAENARRKGLKDLADAIGRDLPKARITERGDGTKVSIMGVRSSSTAGLHGALTNWIAAARRKLDSEGFIKPSVEKENVR